MIKKITVWLSENGIFLQSVETFQNVELANGDAWNPGCKFVSTINLLIPTYKGVASAHIWTKAATTPWAYTAGSCYLWLTPFAIQDGWLLSIVISKAFV